MTTPRKPCRTMADFKRLIRRIWPRHTYATTKVEERHITAVDCCHDGEKTEIFYFDRSEARFFDAAKYEREHGKAQ